MAVQAKTLLIWSIILASVGLLAIPAHAGTKAMLDLLKVLRDRGTINQGEYETLRNAARADEEKAISRQEPFKKATAAPRQVPFKVKTGYNGLIIGSADGAFKFHVGGLLQVDASFIDLTDAGILGGKENNFTVAINWWATPTIMFRLNYIRAETDPGSIATGLGTDEDINIITLRGRVAF